MRKILTGPYGVKLILDSSEVDVDDPGNGTPVIVEYKGGTSTYNAATGEGEVLTDKRSILLPRPVLRWLDSPEIDVEIEKIYVLGEAEYKERKAKRL